MILFNKKFRLAKQIGGNMRSRLWNFAPVAFAGISIVVSAPALADDIKLPPTAILKPAVPVS